MHWYYCRLVTAIRLAIEIDGGRIRKIDCLTDRAIGKRPRAWSGAGVDQRSKINSRAIVADGWTIGVDIDSGTDAIIERDGNSDGSWSAQTYHVRCKCKDIGGLLETRVLRSMITGSGCPVALQALALVVETIGADSKVSVNVCSSPQPPFL